MAYELQQRQIDRQNMIAQALRDSGNIPSSRVNQTAGGFVVPISPFETITKLLEQGAGAYGQYKTGQAEDELNKQKDTDKQAAVSGLMDNLAGPSQMQVPTDPNAPPVGSTTNFESGTGTAEPQQPSAPGAAPVEQNQRRAAMAALLQGQPSDQIIQSLQGAALKKYEPKPDYTLGEDQRRISGDTGATLATGAPKTYKPPAEDRALVDIVDPKAPGGYRSIERSSFKEGTDQLYHKPNTLDVPPMNAGEMDIAVQYAVSHDNQAPNWIGRSPARQREFQHALAQHYAQTGDDFNLAKVRNIQDKTDQSSLMQVTKLADNIGRAKNLLDTNLNSLQKYYDATPNADSEWGNRVLRYWQTGTGDPSLKPVVSFLQAAEKEYAKLQVNSFGNAMTSDAANKAAASAINENFTRGGLKAVIQAMREEGDNSFSTINQTKNEITTRLSERHPHTGVPAVVATPAVPKGTDTPPSEALSQLKEGYETKFGNGQVWTLKDGKPVKVSG